MENNGNQVYCNYHQTNRLLPFILEFLAPSIGLLYMGRLVHGLIKLFCFLTLTLYKPKLGRNNSFIALISVIFFFLYIIDPICIIFGIYYDGNGMPLL